MGLKLKRPPLRLFFFLFLLPLAFALGYVSKTALDLKSVPTGKSAIVFNESSSSALEIKEGDYLVSKVLDGDTIVLANGTHVRYLGLNAPENNERWGLTAAEHNRKLVLNKTVRLELDRTVRDQYGRLLAYVWVDKTMVNEKLLMDGDARTYFVRGEKTLKYRDRLVAAEQWAKDHHYGFWFSDSLE